MTTERTTIALRVLTAINNREKPTDADVFLLHLYCPGNDGLDPDELACLVIQDAIKRKVRVMTGHPGGAS